MLHASTVEPQDAHHPRQRNTPKHPTGTAQYGSSSNATCQSSCCTNGAAPATTSKQPNAHRPRQLDTSICPTGTVATATSPTSRPRGDPPPPHSHTYAGPTHTGPHGTTSATAHASNATRPTSRYARLHCTPLRSTGTAATAPSPTAQPPNAPPARHNRTCSCPTGTASAAIAPIATQPRCPRLGTTRRSSTKWRATVKRTPTD